MEPGRLTEVSRTALGVAMMRATESARPDRLFDDPLAAAFLPAARTVFPVPDPTRPDPVQAVFGEHVAIRTRFYDDYMLAATAAGCRQVVLLAAGLDTRAFRLAWPDGVRLFELDLPELVEYKQQVLAAERAVPRCDRVALGGDLRADWPALLTRAGLRAERPTAWLLEGLLVYFSADEAAGLLTAIGSVAAPGSRLACEYRAETADSALDPVLALPGVARVARMWKGGLGPELPGFLDRAGWRVHAHDGRELAESYGRSGPGTLIAGFLTAVRDEAAGSTS